MYSQMILLTFLTICTLLIEQRCLASIVNVPRAGNMELLILHNNDMHARFEQTSQISSACSNADEQANKCYGGFARVANRVKDAREKANEGTGPPVLYLNAGDTYTGTVWFTLYKWKIAADFINMLRPDAVSLGNHEFDNGVQGLSPFVQNITCPVLCANIDLDKEPELKADTNLKRSVVIDVQGRKVGIIGYLTPETKFLVSPNNVEFIDEVEAIQKDANELIAQGVNILIALGHSGFETDQRIAKEVEGIDLVIGGHSNTFLWNGNVPDVELAVGPYPTMVSQKSGKKVPVVQAYAYTKYLGKLLLTINPEGEIIHYDGQPILLDGSVERDAEVLQLLATYRPRIVSYVETIVGSTKVLLDGATESCRMQECNLGNLITDAMIYAYISSVTPSTTRWTNAPIAIIQGGGIRASINEGNISRADIMLTLPFENEILTAQVTGSILKTILEWSVYHYEEVSGAFLQYSGIHVAYNLSLPAGERVMYARARCGNCLVPEYKEIENDETYTVIMPDFLLEGGDRYTMISESAILGAALGKSDMNVLEEYIEKKSPVYPEVQGRIILHGEVADGTGSGAIHQINVLLVLLLLSSQHYITNLLL